MRCIHFSWSKCRKLIVVQWKQAIRHTNLMSGEGGALTLKGGMGMCRCHDPFLQAIQHSLAYQFTINALLMCPPIYNFRKNLHFQPCFWPEFQLSRWKISEFSLPRPLCFSRKTGSLDPTFGNPRGTYPTKPSWVPPWAWCQEEGRPQIHNRIKAAESRSSAMETKANKLFLSKCW